MSLVANAILPAIILLRNSRTIFSFLGASFRINRNEVFMMALAMEFLTIRELTVSGTDFSLEPNFELDKDLRIVSYKTLISTAM